MAEQESPVEAGVRSIDLWYPAAAGAGAHVGWWLKAAGIEVVGRDGRRETHPWDSWQGVAWSSDGADIHGPGKSLRIDGRMLHWDDLGRRVAGAIRLQHSGGRPFQRQVVEPSERVRLTAAQIREWLELERGEAYHFRWWRGGWSLALVPLGCALQVAGVLLPFFSLVLVGIALHWRGMGSLRHVGRLSADETGVARRQGTDFRHFPWRELSSAGINELYFGIDTMLLLPNGPEARRVCRAAKEILRARAAGALLPDEEVVPPTALSRMEAVEEGAPATALSRAEGGGDG